MLFPLIISLFFCIYASEERKKRILGWASRVFWGAAGLEIFFALLAIWGVR